MEADKGYAGGKHAAAGSLVPTLRHAPWVDSPAHERLVDIEGALAGLDTTDLLRSVLDELQRHRRAYDEAGIVLYAGTNALPSLVRDLHDAQLSSRPSMGWPGEKYQSGLDHVEVLEVLASRLVAESMGANFAEVRLHSATMANLAAYTAFTKPGDVIAVLSEQAGGHTSHQGHGVASVRGLEVEHLPYDVAEWDVDTGRLGEWLARHRPRIVVIGASLMLFPHRAARIREHVDEVGALLVYDASHVAGIIAGGRFQRPLDEGAHLVTFSTYKSYGGPAGGAVVCNDPDIAQRISAAAYPVLTANYDAGRLAPLAARASQHLLEGSAYADDCLANARVLAEALVSQGLLVAAGRRGYTASHHVAVDVRHIGGGQSACDRLAAAGIFSSAIGLPDQDPAEPPVALRFGTQELTSRRADADDITSVGKLVADVLVRGESADAVRTRVRRVRERLGGTR